MCLFYDATIALINKEHWFDIGNLSRENAVCAEAAKTISPLYYERTTERLPSGLSIIALAYNICTRVVYIHTGVKFDCTKCTIRGQCTWRPANKPGHCASYLPISDSSVYERASAGRAPILKFHSDRWKRERREEDERIAEQAIYSNRWFIRAFKRWQSKFSARLRLIFALILDDFVREVPEVPLSVLTDYSSIGRGYITADLKKALWVA